MRDSPAEAEQICANTPSSGGRAYPGVLSGSGDMYASAKMEVMDGAVYQSSYLPGPTHSQYSSVYLGHHVPKEDKICLSVSNHRHRPRGGSNPNRMVDESRMSHGRMAMKKDVDEGEL